MINNDKLVKALKEFVNIDPMCEITTGVDSLYAKPTQPLNKHTVCYLEGLGWDYINFHMGTSDKSFFEYSV